MIRLELATGYFIDLFSNREREREREKERKKRKKKERLEKKPKLKKTFTSNKFLILESRLEEGKER